MHGTIISTTVAAMLALSGIGAHPNANRPNPTPVAWSQPTGDAVAAEAARTPALPDTQ